MTRGSTETATRPKSTRDDDDLGEELDGQETEDSKREGTEADAANSSPQQSGDYQIG
jgi:hypothetical protein